MKFSFFIIKNYNKEYVLYIQYLQYIRTKLSKGRLIKFQKNSLIFPDKKETSENFQVFFERIEL